GRASARKASISAGVGGRPVRSNVARRSSVRRSASGENVSPFFWSAASRNASIGLRTDDCGSRTTGTGGGGGGGGAAGGRAGGTTRTGGRHRSRPGPARRRRRRPSHRRGRRRRSRRG